MSTNRFLRAVLPRSSRTLTLTVEAGQVVCPRRGIIDMERCFACAAFRGSPAPDLGTVVCRPTITPIGEYVPTVLVPR